MRKLVRSSAYVRAKMYSGGLFILFGATIVVRMFAVVGLHATIVPGIVLGCAMIALGLMRVRDARAVSRR